jgi:ATP-binding cassette, subfamily B, bacterial PglK
VEAELDYRSQMMIPTLRKCMAMVPASRRTGWMVVPILAALSGVMEAGAVGAIYLLVRVLQDPQVVFELSLLGPAERVFRGAADSTIVLRFAVLLGVYHVVKNLFMVGTQYLRQRVQAETEAELSKVILRGYLLLPYPFHFGRHSSELIRNTTGSVGTVVHVIETATSFLLESLIGLGVIAVLLTAAPGVTIASGIALVLLISGLLRLTRRMAERSGQERHDLSKSLHQTVQDALGGIKEIKALGRETYFIRAFADVHRRRLDLGYLGVTLGLIPRLVVETAFVLAALTAVVLVVLRPPATGEVLPLIGLFAYAGFRLVPMSHRIVLQLNGLRASRPAVDELYDDYVLINRDADQGSGGDEDGVTFGSELRVEGVSYTYPNTTNAAVTGVSLTLQAGCSLGIVGPTGAGKSTLVDLVVGLLPPDEGRILADGLDLGSRRRRWRHRIGYVPQSIFLLDDTLRRNIAMGVRSEDIDQVAVERAIRMAQLDTLVNSWPEGVECLLGERGIRLSGGERQRVGIARALYHDPELLVFDEATSALDNVTEAEVNRAIESLRGRKSMLIIAHRLSTVRRCDSLLYMEDGRIVAEGSYDELLASHDRFRRMAEATAGLSEPILASS